MGRRKPVTDPLAEPWRVLTDSDKQWVNTQLGYCGLSYPPPKPSGLIESAHLQHAIYAQTLPNRLARNHTEEIAIAARETQLRQERQDQARWKREAEERLLRQVERRERGSRSAQIIGAYGRGMTGVIRTANGKDSAPRVVNPANDPFYDQL